jgi:UDP:flavonoid glycosyltransferase YjiC (YdhE family)
MKRITIIASGTRGDVQPAIALGKALQTTGYRVRILASPNFRGWIEGHGLEAAPARVNVQEIMESEGGQEWVERGHNPMVQMRVMKKLLDKFGWQLIMESWEACQGADAIISSFTSDTFAVTIAEKLDVPHFSMPLQPTIIATRDGRCMPNVPFPNRVSRVNEWFGKLLIEPFPWRLYGEHTNRLRQQMDLPPQTNKENIAARRQMIALHAVSRHVLPFPADWPDNFHITGYWFLDEEPDWQPPAELVDFLAAGPPPVYIGFGSMTNSDPVATTRLVIEAVRQSGQRAILLSGWAGMGQMDLPPQILRLASAPHSWLFPRMAAVVHHGGAGTMAAGLRAGVPNVVVPHMVDQPYWGQRVHSLGVGPKPVPRHKLTAVKLTKAIQQAVTDEAMKQNAAALGAKIRQEDGLGNAMGVINRIMRA